MLGFFFRQLWQIRQLWQGQEFGLTKLVSPNRLRKRGCESHPLPPIALHLVLHYNPSTQDSWADWPTTGIAEFRKSKSS